MVLLVEDEELMRTLVRKILEIEGHEVLSAKDGDEALKLARAYNGGIDLLLTDVQMARLNGFDLVALFRAERPNARVLIISGQRSNELTAIARKLPFLAKPFFPSDFQKKLREVMRGPAGESHVY